MRSSINRKSWAERPVWAKNANVEQNSGHVITRGRPAAQDDINIENVVAFGKLVQVLTPYWRPFRCFVSFPAGLRFFLIASIKITISYSSAVPIFRTTSVLKIGTVFEPT